MDWLGGAGWFWFGAFVVTLLLNGRAAFKLLVDWKGMLGLLAEKNYTGYLSYEAPNPDLWAPSPYDVAREGVELTRKLLRDAVPGYSK